MKYVEQMPLPEDELIPTRATLLSRLKNWNDQESWNSFFHIYWRLIYRSARRAGLGKEEAQDVVQETIVSVSKSIPNFKYDPKNGSFKGWLLQLTRWRIKDQLRKRLPKAVINEDASGTPVWPVIAEEVPHSQGLLLESVWNDEWDRTILDAAVERLKRKVNLKHFQIFDLNVLQDIPAPKVKEMLHVSIGRIYLIKHRLSALLKKEIARLEKSFF